MNSWLRPPHRLVLVFLVATLVPSVALVWIGWKFLVADRELERQRVHDSLDAVASGAAVRLERELATLDRRLPAFLAPGTESPGEFAIAVRLTTAGVTANAGAPLLYRPAAPSTHARESPTDALADAELLEYGSDLDGALRAYRALANSANAHSRAEALLGVARVHRKADRIRDALATYDEMSRLHEAMVGGDPASLVLRWARVDLFTRAGLAEARQEAALLTRDLGAGRWPIDRTTYLGYLELLSPFREIAAGTSSTAAVLTEAVVSAWDEWHATPAAGRFSASSGRYATRIADVPIVCLWRRDGDTLLALAVTPALFKSVLAAERAGETFDISIADDAERSSAGDQQTGRQSVVRHTVDTGLPWAIRVTAVGAPDAIASAGVRRRRLLLSGLLLLGLLVPATAVVVARAVQRDLALASQQADFVSAVSHEFRSPLTSLTHLTSLLRGHPPVSDVRRQQYYVMLSRETDRLRRFVDTLLDFGRIRAGAARYRLVTVNPASLVEPLVGEFRTDADSRAHPVSVTAEMDLPAVSADSDALGRALWNLLENAAKYSPEAAPIDVRVDRVGAGVAIRVKDVGPGVPAHERLHIFDPFYRGAAATASAVPGTGVGLAVASHIVSAHHGTLALESTPGAGSTFSILLPAVETRASETQRAS